MECYRKQKATAKIISWGQELWTNSKDSVNVKFVLAAALGEEIPDPLQINNKKKNEKNYESELLCCWQADGNGDIVSEWKRSVPFKEVVKLYRELLKLHNENIYS